MPDHPDMTPEDFRQELLAISQSVPLDVALGGLVTMILALVVSHYDARQQLQLVGKLSELLHTQLATAQAVQAGWPDTGVLH